MGAVIVFLHIEIFATVYSLHVSCSYGCEL